MSGTYRSSWLYWTSFDDSSLGSSPSRSHTRLFTPLESYTKAAANYTNLSAAEVERMEDGEVDDWIMALPNGICKMLLTMDRRSTRVTKRVPLLTSARILGLKMVEIWTSG